MDEEDDVEIEKLCFSRFFEDDFESTHLSPNHISRTPTNLPDPQNLSQSSIGSDSDMLSLSQLTLDEQELEPLHIEPFYNITPRLMPQSPHYVLEEEFSTNPWSILIATIFLTKTSGKTARRYMKQFFEDYPTPYHVLGDSPTSLERFFDNLGLKKRGATIWKLTYQFVSSKWRRASDLYGIGKYGEDAYRLFCLGHTDLDPDDRYLKLYLNWLSGHTEFLEDNGVLDGEIVMEDPVLEYYRITLRNGTN